MSRWLLLHVNQNYIFPLLYSNDCNHSPSQPEVSYLLSLPLQKATFPFYLLPCSNMCLPPWKLSFFFTALFISLGCNAEFRARRWITCGPQNLSATVAAEIRPSLEVGFFFCGKHLLSKCPPSLPLLNSIILTHPLKWEIEVSSLCLQTLSYWKPTGHIRSRVFWDPSTYFVPSPPPKLTSKLTMLIMTMSEEWKYCQL